MKLLKKEFIKMVEEHVEEIEKKYDKKIAQKANIGWGTFSDSIASKIYLPKGTQILNTSCKKSGVYEHQWSVYKNKG